MDAQETVLAVIDVQGKLATLVHEHERLLINIERSITIARILKIPILWTEQAPDKIGPTIGSIAGLLSPVAQAMPKRTFSCYGSDEFRQALARHRRPRVLIAGIETHVCVYQTARDLQRHGYMVDVIADAVSARGKRNNDIALVRMRQMGIGMTGVELAACEFMGTADHPHFKEIMTHVKR